MVEKTPDAESFKILGGLFEWTRPCRPAPRGYFKKRLILNVAANSAATFLARLIGLLIIAWAFYGWPWF